jgi:hypothetical protein
MIEIVSTAEPLFLRKRQITQRQFYKCKTFVEYSKSDDRGQYRVFLNYAVKAGDYLLVDHNFLLPGKLAFDFIMP